MIYELYRVLNVLLLLLLGLFLCALQSVFLKIPVIAWLELDPILLMVVYLSLHRKLIEGSLIVLVVSRFLEVHSGAPVGLLSACYLMVFLAILFTKEMFLVGNTFSAIILAMSGGLVWKFIFLVMAQRYGILENLWQSSLSFLVPYLLGLGISAHLMFNLLRWIDRVTKYDREADSRMLMGEDF